ncbi:MAG: hypothetical protein Q8R28_03935 [Dehalococcoidia bacterium]|nr:hypothetical protein [Dehalococcoidia bacterium]
MAKELKHIDITDRPEVLQLVREARNGNESLLLRQENEDVAILRPVKRAPKRRVSQGKPFTKDDPLWNLAGIGQSGLGDVSANKHKYLDTLS